jgi:predicted ATPase
MPPLAIPTILLGSLLARLDRLAPVRDVAQVAAAVGREFTAPLVATVAQRPARVIEAALAQLVAAELIFPLGASPATAYTFKHALVQEAAYATLLRERRRRLHARIAHVLESEYPEVARTQPETLAHHYSAAGLVERALPYWLGAGQRAARRSANREAISHLMKGLEQLKSLPDGSERAHQERAFQTALGPALLATSGWGASEGMGTYLRARALCEQIGSTAQLFPILWGTWMFRWARGEISTARGLVDELLALAQQEGKLDFQLQAHHAGWTTFTFLGDLETALYHAEAGVAIYRPEEHGSLALDYGGHDPGVCARAHASQPLWLAGYPDKALRKSQQSLALASELSHGPSVAHALFHAVWLDQFRRDDQSGRGRAEALITRAYDQGQMLYVAIGTIFLGWALAAGGDYDEGIDRIRQGLDRFQATGAKNWMPYYAALLAERLGKAGCADEALSVLQVAQHAATRAADWFFWEAEMVRLEGELCLCSPSGQSGAEENFQRAITIAREQHAKSLELRAAASLAQLWKRRGKIGEACEMLAPIYGWFTEGFDTPDLIEAKALLDEMRG